MANCFRIAGDSILLNIKAAPGASKSQIAGLSGDRLRIKIAAPPEDGKANAELRSFLAKALDCSRKDIALITGEKSRLKTAGLPLSCLEKLEKIIPA
ncbi:MAG: DUF167 domain-containing protein [Treponema sp.]|jgi:uncharacterized protein (TIGR00251 family)|nr:DUF167 domain-containing protein [Treponema sp.]